MVHRSRIHRYGLTYDSRSRFKGTKAQKNGTIYPMPSLQKQGLRIIYNLEILLQKSIEIQYFVWYNYFTLNYI